MTGARRSMLWAALSLALAGAARCEGSAEPTERAAATQPFETLRAIELAQDRLVQGDTGAQHKLPKLIAQAAEDFLGADRAVWRDPRNARALIAYGLSGGPVRVVRAIAKANAFSEPEKTLVEGTLAYAEGREARARQILLPIDAKALPPLLGGHIAIVQSGLVAKDDPRSAMAFLDKARLLAPGTLIEETSLRREVLLAEETGAVEQFANLSGQYIHRYGKSVYAASFRQSFAACVLRLGVTGEKSQFDKLEGVLDEIDPADRLSLYLKIARAAIIDGKLEPALRVAESAARLAPGDTIEAARARLYEAAALALTTETDVGLARLRSMEVSRLADSDVDLKDAVIELATQIRSADKRATTWSDSGPGSPPSGRDSPASEAASTLIDEAQKAIDTASELLARANRP